MLFELSKKMFVINAFDWTSGSVDGQSDILLLKLDAMPFKCQQNVFVSLEGSRNALEPKRN